VSQSARPRRIHVVEGKPPTSPPAKRDTPWSLIIFAALAVYAILIALLNKEEVDISFVFFSTRISKLVLILLCLGIGFAAGFMVDRWRARRRRAASAE
jgi:uncharacterized integral membrane protein